MNLQRLSPALWLTLTLSCSNSAATKPDTEPNQPPTTSIRSDPHTAFELPPGAIVFVSERDGDPELYAIRSDGSQLTRLSKDPGGNYAGPPSPVGDQLLMLRSEDGAAGHTEQMHLLTWSNGKVQEGRPLGPTSIKVRNPAWTIDGTSLVFESDSASFRDLYRVAVTGGEVVRLTDNREGNFEPTIRGDGTIAFVSSRTNIPAIYTMKPDGSDVRRLTEPPGHCSSPVWSPDGSMIAFVRTGPQSSEVHVMQADGTGQRPLRTTPRQTGTDRDLAWSPSGKWLALTHHDRDATEVSRIEVARGSELVLSQKSEVAQQPVWIASDAQLVWSATVADNADLYAYDLNHKQTVRLTRHPAPDWLPRWLGSGPSSDRPTPAQAPPSAP